MPAKKPKTKKPSVSKAKVDKETVAKLAYELYLRRGGEHGRHEQDWLLAEQMLIEEQKRSAPRRRASDAKRRLEDKFRK